MAQEAPALLVKGRLERGDGDVLNVVAERLERFPVELAEPAPPTEPATGSSRSGSSGVNLRSRDFR